MSKYIGLIALLAAGNLQAWSCDHERTIEAELDLSDSEKLSILAAAGDLEIEGSPGRTTALITGKVCASKEAWLDESRILTSGGRNAEIAVDLPSNKDGWSWTGNNQLYMDLRVLVPDHIALDVKDSSGDMEVLSTGTVEIRDSSGDIEVEDVRGDVVLNDSSGDIDLMDIDGNVFVRQDSSGDIYGRDILGAVIVERDSSGDIRFRDVRDDFVVERDSSGDIVASNIGGDFRVVRDGSGSIDSRGVKGTVDIPDKG